MKTRPRLTVETSPIPLTFKWKIIFFQFFASALNVTIQGYPQGLQTNLLAPPYNFTNFQYGIFYGIPSFPNIILPIFVGMYIDKHGFSLYMVICLEALVILGISIVALGSCYVSYSIMVIGQFLMGIGSENIQLLIKRFVLKLSSKEDSLKIWGINLVSLRVGTLLSSTMGPLIYSWTENVSDCFYFEIFIAIAVCICFNLSYLFSFRAGILDPLPNKENNDDETSLVENESMIDGLKRFFKQTDRIFWLVILLISTNFIMIYGLFSEVNNLIMKASNISSLEASYFLVFYSILAGFFQVLDGFVFARLGYYIYTMIIGCFFQIISSFLFIGSFLMNNEYSAFLPLGFFAFGYSLSSTFVFSSIAFIVDRKFYGVAYGVVQCAMDFGATFGSTIFGFIKDISLSVMEGYFWPLIETATFQTLNLILALSILILDAFTLKVLSKKRQVILEIQSTPSPHA